ncbi:hypothetical protein L1987_60729 [Smallanthus sonchifolius]|uniref:Uncharacterized protein n=1 Tax=Smallanthus sonchifolius TaxID=185202 RepID=A0ACB9D9H6_9ASTR|nr:hypothetical protein L1987_60729 [Smallanthus sonchifolius]
MSLTIVCRFAGGWDTIGADVDGVHGGGATGRPEAPEEAESHSKQKCVVEMAIADLWASYSVSPLLSFLFFYPSSALSSGSSGSLLLTCICPCCLCVTVLVEIAIELIKAPIHVMSWFTSKIPC